MPSSKQFLEQKVFKAAENNRTNISRTAKISKVFVLSIVKEDTLTASPYEILLGWSLSAIIFIDGYFISLSTLCCEDCFVLPFSPLFLSHK
jgi:hypothetical protein